MGTKNRDFNRNNLTKSMKKLILEFSTLLILITGTLISYSATVALAYNETASCKRESTVLICISPNAHAYHTHLCNGLNRCTHEIKEVTESIARAKGYSPCKICYR